MGTVTLISEVNICNTALARIGSTQSITSFDDGSNEAAQCAIFYPGNRDAMLSDFPWPWAEAYDNLAQVAGPETTQSRANSQWLRSYRYPSNCLKMRRIVCTPFPIEPTTPPQTTGTFTYSYYWNEPWRRAVGDAYPVSYGLGNDDDGRLIMSDFFGPYGLTAIFTQNVTDPSQFTPDFADCLAWRLASDLALALAFDPKKRDYAEKKYDETSRRSRSTAMNELQSDVPFLRRQSEVIRARWGG